MNKREKKQKKNKIIVIIVVLVIIFLFRWKIEPFNKMVAQLFLPIQSKIFLMTDSLNKKYTSVTNYKYILKEKEELKLKNLFLQTEQLQTENLREENERLRELLKLQKKDHKIKFGLVTFKDLMNLYEFFYINRGKDDDVTPNMVVLSGNNVIGRVIEVFDNIAKIEMVTNENFVISSKTESGIMGIATGNREYNNRIIFTPSLDKGTVKIGEIIISSGISEVYPAGLIIGKIVEKVEDEVTYIVEPCVDLIKLKEVILYTEKVKNDNKL